MTKLIKKPNCKLFYDKVLTTAVKIKDSKTEGGIILPNGAKEAYLDEQEVLVVGEGVSDNLEVGDTVRINFNNYMRPTRKKRPDETVEDTMEFFAPIEEINGEEYFLILQRDIVLAFSK